MSSHPGGRMENTVSQREQRNQDIRQFVVEHVREHPRDIAALVAGQFGVSRQAAVSHLRRLQAEGVLAAQGETRSRRYQLNPTRTESFAYSVTPDVAEDAVWRRDIGPMLTGVKTNVRAICAHGFQEIFNNALEHSEGRKIDVDVRLWPDVVEIDIHDDGVGIFNKIQRDLGLDDPLLTILELSKGKLTTDPRQHSGEGIFFTRRMFDQFAIFSGRLCFVRLPSSTDYLAEDRDAVEGTQVKMQISLSSERTTQSVFNQYSLDDFGFDRTVVPVFLAQYGQENLISRSQARRLLARFDRFKEVVLDFAKVDVIGQAFADEIFRVYAREHPQVALRWMNASGQVAGMIARAQNTD
jgi:anti-sigma regulatory factor (Ser/Thr protein kinase)